MKKLANNLLLLLVSMAFALLVGEALVRTFAPQDLRLNVTRWDEYLGFWHIPNMEGYTKHRDYTMHVKINEKGLRDRNYPYEKPVGTFRVGVFGDSFTFGEGVQNDEAYTAVLDRMFESYSEDNAGLPDIEIINFGVGKTGTSQQYGLYLREGRKYALDMVILGFLGGNDLDDNLKGIFFIENGELVHNPASYSTVREIQRIVYKIPFYRWLATNSHLVNFLRIMATRMDDRQRIEHNLEQITANNGVEPDSPEPEYLDLTLRLVDEFRHAVNEDDAVFVFLNLPAKKQKPAAEYGDSDDIPSYVLATETLLENLESKDVRVIDLVPVFHVLRNGKYYFENDGHMTSDGHVVIAEKLFDQVKSSVEAVAADTNQSSQ